MVGRAIPFPLDTARMTLRPLRDSDLDDVMAYRGDPAVHRFLCTEAGTAAETAQGIAHKAAMIRWTDECRAIVAAMELKATGRVVGEVSLFELHAEHRRGEIGFVVAPDHQGRGLAREAAAAMLAAGFEHLGLHRIYGRCDAANTASYKLMEALGMRREAHFIENEWFKGAWGSEYVYAILRREFEARRESR